MSRDFFGAIRDFAFLRAPFYLRWLALVLIFASPALATLYSLPRSIISVR